MSAPRNECVVAVFAHPDDESLACGGTLARLADAGVHVSVVSASHGELGSPDHENGDQKIADIRAGELRDAAAALGIAEVIILDYPDGELRWTLLTQFRAELAMILARRRPAAVVTFGEDGLYWHDDHIAVHEQTSAVVRSLGADRPALYYVTIVPGIMTDIVHAARRRGWTSPVGGFWSLAPEAFGYGARQPALVVDVGQWVPRKLSALQCHRSQMGTNDPFSQLDAPSASRLLGVEHFHRAEIPASKPLILESLACTSRR
jgi:LmbE family N-acetylglucosaminyl deacetylase